MKVLMRYKLTLLGVAIGAMVGGLYYYFIGCESGCAIASSPLNSTLYGAMMGGLFLNLFRKE